MIAGHSGIKIMDSLFYLAGNGMMPGATSPNPALGAVNNRVWRARMKPVCPYRAATTRCVSVWAHGGGGEGERGGACGAHAEIARESARERDGWNEGADTPLPLPAAAGLLCAAAQVVLYF